jgi:hypothetical protein
MGLDPLHVRGARSTISRGGQARPDAQVKKRRCSSSILRLHFAAFPS